MKKLLLSLALGLLFLSVSSCGPLGNVRWSPESQDILIDAGASEAGYRIGLNNLGHIDQWSGWADNLLALEPGAPTKSLDDLLVYAVNKIAKDPYEQMQLNKLIKLIEFPEIQDPELPYLVEEYIVKMRIMVEGFKGGLQTAKKMAELKGG